MTESLRLRGRGVFRGGAAGAAAPPPIAHAQEIFTLFKYPNIGKDTSKLHRNSTEIAEVVL